jgi:hypothetical protein
MATISWGKPQIFIGPTTATIATSASSGTNDWYLLSTPVEDSTSLTGTQGDKTEATIEGGEAEATRYNAATFELTMNVRMAIDSEGSTDTYRYLPNPLYKEVTGNNARTEYTASSVAVVLIPKEPAAPGFYCPDCSVSIMETYTAADGAMWEITLAPNASGTVKAVQWGQRYAVKSSTAGQSGTADAGIYKYKIVKGVQSAS